MQTNRGSIRNRVKAMRVRARVVALLAIIMVAGGAYYFKWAVLDSHFTTVTAHQLYQSGKIDPDKLLDVTTDHGIRSVIDLRTFVDDAEGIAAERAALENSDVSYLHLPTGHEPDDETILRFLNFVGNPSNRPALVHCYHGTGRSVLFGALYRIEFENWDNEKARRAVEPLHWRGNFGPNSVKGKYLASYRPHNTTVIFAADD